MSAAVRADLLDLTPEALMALANAGFVKRAQKDVAAGLLPKLEVDADGAVHAAFDDGTRTSLPAGRTLRDANCNCAASGMCRHRVMLVLAYQATQRASGDVAVAGASAGSCAVAEAGDAADAWSPAQFDDAALAASFSATVLEQAARLAASRPVITVQPWAGANIPPAARLPMCSVRFFSRSALAHARCDCKLGGGCAHVVLAVWAFREAGALAPGGAGKVVELRPPSAADDARDGEVRARLSDDAARQARDALDALLLMLWLDGSGQAQPALGARLAATRARVQALNWQWVDDALDEIDQLARAQLARSSRYEPLRLLRVLAELSARVQAAFAADAAGSAAPLPASRILGVGVKGQVELDHLRLVSLGAEIWADEDAHGASVLFADPDTQTVMAFEREWPRKAAGAAVAASLAERRVAGVPLRQLAAGQVVTKAATRRANGLVEIGTGARQTGVLPLSPTSWDELVPPLRQPGVAELIAHLRDAQPDFVQPRLAANSAAAGAAGTLYVLAFEPMSVASVSWDATGQTLYARIVQEGQDEALHLELPHRAASPGAVDALARVLAGEWGALRALAGNVRLHAGRPIMRPLAVLTAQRGIALQTEPAATQPLPLQRSQVVLPEPAALAEDTLTLLGQWLREGIRHLGGAATGRALAQAERLERAGLGESGRALRALAQGLQGVERGTLPARLSWLTLLLFGIAEE